MEIHSELRRCRRPFPNASSAIQYLCLVSLNRNLPPLVTGGDTGGATEGCPASNCVSTNGFGLHEVCAQAGIFSVQLGTELHQRDRVEIFRHKRIRYGQANEVSRGWRDVDRQHSCLQVSLYC